MRKTWKWLAPAASAALVVACSEQPSAPTTAQPTMSVAARNVAITDLGTLGGTFSTANAINDAGWVVGESDLAAQPGVGHAFLWRNGVMTDLGTLGGSGSIARGINDRGDVVGISQTAGDAEWHAFRWSHGTMTDLGPGEAFVVSNAGDIAMNNGHAVLLRHGTLTDLGTFGGSWSWANGLSNSGAVAGGAALQGDGAQHPFLWSDGVMTDLGTLGGNWAGASSVNGHGTVVGGSTTEGDVTTHAFIWQRGQMSDLGTPSGDFHYAYAKWINDEGQTAGYSCTEAWTYTCHAVLWGPDGAITELAGFPGAFEYIGANAINARGQAVGWAVTPGFELHAVLWTTR